MKIQGTVKHFNHNKGFGFLKRDDNGPDIFIGRHQLPHSARRYGVQPGDRLAFEIGADGKSGKPRATNVEFIDAPSDGPVESPVRFGSDQPWID